MLHWSNSQILYPTHVHMQHVFLSRKIFPLAWNRRLLHCGDGSWQREYSKLHRDILAGEAPPRYLLAQGQNGAEMRCCHIVTVSWRRSSRDKTTFKQRIEGGQSALRAPQENLGMTGYSARLALTIPNSPRTLRMHEAPMAQREQDPMDVMNTQQRRIILFESTCLRHSLRQLGFV